MTSLNSANVATRVVLLALTMATGSAAPVQAQTAPAQPSAPMPQPMPQPMPTPGPAAPGTMTDPTPEQQKCQQQLAGYRTAVESRAREAAAESKKRPTRARMCELVSDYAVAELAWLTFAETNMVKCGIPPQLVEQIKAVQVRTIETRKRMCASAPR
ncbi:MAG TPA: hypothetical protein VKX28_32520 [Xanthobacteraceae bacterium]|nr:hypothetical protein [Xanthobacteraceae bacterium]